MRSKPQLSAPHALPPSPLLQAGGPVNLGKLESKSHRLAAQPVDVESDSDEGSNSGRGGGKSSQANGGPQD